MEKAYPIVTKAHYTQGSGGGETGNHDLKTRSGTQPYMVSLGQVWQRAGQLRVTVYHQSDRSIWD